eukprot:CAMPEP_0169261614 /NCGR_PEP_ID=MMETSP1016-20121227/43197_1 /TAXON_ID=342587 /ORGANISM="Karlodinium micrum, Strain CCMP2283" /LENGTH=136 /DNA_ID=CAMNT_0009343943 /DNA_START=808 /DNA_END=1219 /DNA_ORIENTATION=-
MTQIAAMQAIEDAITSSALPERLGVRNVVRSSSLNRFGPGACLCIVLALVESEVISTKLLGDIVFCDVPVPSSKSRGVTDASRESDGVPFKDHSRSLAELRGTKPVLFASLGEMNASSTRSIGLRLLSETSFLGDA